MTRVSFAGLGTNSVPHPNIPQIAHRGYPTEKLSALRAEARHRNRVRNHTRLSCACSSWVRRVSSSAQDRFFRPLAGTLSASMCLAATISPSNSARSPFRMALWRYARPVMHFFGQTPPVLYQRFSAFSTPPSPHVRSRCPLVLRNHTTNKANTWNGAAGGGGARLCTGRCASVLCSKPRYANPLP